MANGTAYFDQAWLAVGPVYKYTVPSTIILGPHFVAQQAREDQLEGPYHPIQYGPTEGRTLRVEGMGYLTRPASDTATTEVDGARVDLIVAKAKENMCRMLWAQDQDDKWLFIQEDAAYEVAELLRRPGVRMRAMSAGRSDGVWHIEEDSSGRYIVFERV